MGKKTIVYYIYDRKLLEVSKNIPNIGNRAAVVQSLIASYNLLTKCEICPIEEATDDTLLSFHSRDYIDVLRRAHESTDLEKLTDSDDITDFNLGYDCPLFEKMYDFAKVIAGSSLTGAKLLISRTLQVKRKLQNCIPANSQPKSYLRVRNPEQGGTRVPKTDIFDMPDNLSFDEDIEVHSRSENDPQSISKPVRGYHARYETELTMSSSDIQPIAINWFGGWHHAQRDEAGGFCYVNDIVIAIQYLLRFCKRLLYIDLDIHHGNGVEDAFSFSSRVLTFSIHKFEPGFYPATGSVDDVGHGAGKYYSVNIPLKSGITDDKYWRMFEPVFRKIMKRYRPDCVVVQCGADCMPGDPLGGFNITPTGLGKCMRAILDQKLPTLVLGGGGYNVVNTAKCWTYLTSLIVDQPISNDIPEHNFLNLYGPEFEVGISPSLRKDENADEYLDDVLRRVLDNLDNLPGVGEVAAAV